MKILSVEITNITSIEGPYLIDFENEIFSNIGLFGITGPVGAGKSSIIDSICLGLYNTTPRLDRNNSATSIQYEAEVLTTNNSQNLLRRGAGSGSVVVRFKAIDGHIWKSTWLLRRARDTANGKLQGVTMTLINESLNEVYSDNKITKVLDKIKTLIGLDFKQFTKSVILAQGDFQAFLNATDNERAQILEKLTGTEIYSEISKAIYTKNEAIKENFKQLNNEIQALHLMSDDELVALENKIKELEIDFQGTKLIAEQLQNFEKWYESYNELNSKKNKIQEELLATQNQLNLMKQEIDLLQHVEKVQDIKPQVIENLELTLNIDNYTKDVTNLHTQSEHLTTEKKSVQNLINTASNNKTTIREQIIQNEPLYIKARELDVQIQNTHKIAYEIDEKIKQRRDGIKQGEELISKQKQIHAVKITQNNEIKLWLDANEKIKYWAENSSLLQHQFLKLDQINESIVDLLTNHKTIKNSALATSHQQEIIKQQKDTAEKHLTQILADIEIEKLKIKNQNIEQSIAKQAEISEQKNTLDQLKNITEKYIDVIKHLNKSKIELKDSENKLKIEEEFAEQISKKLSIVKQQFEKQKFYYDKLKLESSNNVVHLRNQLQPGCECPVCGSTEHKIEKVTVINSLINQAETELKELESQEVEYTTEYNQSMAQTQFLTQAISQSKININELELESKLIFDKWHTTPLLNFNLQLNQDNILEAIKEQDNILNQENKTITDYIKQYTTTQLIIDQKEVEKNKYVLLFEEAKELLNQLNIDEEKFKTKLEQITLDGEKIRNEQKNNLASLNQIINQENWENSYQANPNQFKLELFNQINTWQINIQKIEQLNQDINGIEQELAKLNSTKIEQNKDLDLLLNEQQKNNNQLHIQQNARKTYFNGENVDTVEARLKNQLQENELVLEKLQNQYQEIETKYIQITTTITQKQQLIDHYNQKKTQNTEQINYFITQNENHISNLNLNVLQKLCTYSHDWITKTRNSLENTKQEIIRLDGAQKIITEQIDNYLKTKPELTLDEIHQNKQAINKVLQEKQDLIIAEKGKLFNHHKNIDSQKTLIKQREAIMPDYNEWNELNNLFGSSGGDKLKKLAQQFTLDLLLQAANAQLQQINNRYILERINDTLSILVIDQYMANTKRATNSLSGGETFLVSLALSLALSTISSTQLQVESLFIDEGFGSLDPNSLETAFLALENLQNQGRMVGIISHLDSVIDRLTVKIEVTPQGNGKSKIQIVA